MRGCDGEKRYVLASYGQGQWRYGNNESRVVSAIASESWDNRCTECAPVAVRFLSEDDNMTWGAAWNGLTWRDFADSEDNIDVADSSDNRIELTTKDNWGRVAGRRHSMLSAPCPRVAEEKSERRESGFFQIDCGVDADGG